MYIYIAHAMTLFVLALPAYVHASTANECVRGATGNDVAALDYQITSGTCVDAATIAIVQPDQSAAAKAYLKTVNRSEKSKCNTASDPSIDRLNPGFAICAANFIKAYQSRYGSITITSAFRTPSQQKCVCPVPKSGTCGAPGVYDPKTGTVIGGSNHQRGIAMDIHPSNGNYAQMKEFADANPSFGVSFPLYPGDKPHMQPTNKSDPKCASPGYATTLSGSETAGSPNTIISDTLRTQADTLFGTQESTSSIFEPAPETASYSGQSSSGVSASPSLSNSFSESAIAPRVDIAPIVGKPSNDISPTIGTGTPSTQEQILSHLQEVAQDHLEETTVPARPLTHDEISSFSNHQSSVLYGAQESSSGARGTADMTAGIRATATFSETTDTESDSYGEKYSGASGVFGGGIAQGVQYALLYVSPFSPIRYDHESHE